MIYNNKVVLYGTILNIPRYSHKFDDELFYSLDIEVPLQFQNSDKTTIVHLFVGGNMLTDLAIVPGHYYEVVGLLVTSAVKGIKDSSVLISSIEDLDSEGSSEYVSSLAFSGKVSKIFTKADHFNGFFNFLIEGDPSLKRVISSRVVIWGKLAKEALSILKVGDFVNISGYLSNTITKPKFVTDSEDTNVEKQIRITEVIATTLSVVNNNK